MYLLRILAIIIVRKKFIIIDMFGLTVQWVDSLDILDFGSREHEHSCFWIGRSQDGGIWSPLWLVMSYL